MVDERWRERNITKLTPLATIKHTRATKGMLITVAGLSEESAAGAASIEACM